MLKNFISYNLRYLIGLFTLILLGFGWTTGNAQNVSVLGATIGNGSYPTLNAAFTAINGNAQLGANITISIVGNTVEGAPATLNGGFWASFNITPVGNRQIVGSLNGPLIDFNSADIVVIDGLNNGSNSLTINNQSQNSIASTIQFRQEAKGNRVSNCSILGSSTGLYSSPQGATILFATATTGTGNDNNTISDNDIGPSGTNLPYQAIKSHGTASRENKNNTIDRNLIHDYFSGATSTSNSKGIIAYTNTTHWTISNNRFYQSATRTWQASGSSGLYNIYSCIDVEFGSGYNITGNILGFANSAGTGYSVFVPQSGQASMIQALIINQTTATLSNISSNIIAGFDLTSSRIDGALGYNIFLGIYLIAGNVSISGNTIGSISSNNSILIRSTSTASPVTFPRPAIGIYTLGSGNIDVSNNNIGGIHLSLQAPGVVGSDKTALYGIYNQSTGLANILNNTVGGTLANSITSSHTLESLIGIYNAGATLQVTIEGNTIQNLTHTNANVGVNQASSVIGILEKPSVGTTGNIIVGNIIYNISNSYSSSSAVIHVKGILLNPFSAGAGTSIVERNWIHTLNVSSTAIGSSINGIHCLLNAEGYLFNNMISLGNGLAGNLKIIGILQNSMRIFAYHNSIRIVGTDTGTDLSACYSYTTGGYVCRTFNNIFYNERTGTTNNYAFHTLAAITSYQSSHNLFYTSGPAFTMYNNVAYATLATFSAATGGQNSPFNTKQLPVVFTSSIDLHTSDLNVRNVGLSPLSPAVTLDFDNTIRPTCVDIGCDEFDVAIIPGTAFTWLGTINTQWCQPCNWDRETLPTTTDDVIIQDNRPFYPWLQPGVGCGDVTVHDFTMQQNVNPALSASINLGVYTLSITGDVSITGSCTCTGATSFTALTTGLIDLIGTSQSQSVDIRGADGNYPGNICKLRVNKTQPTAVASANHEAYLRGNLLIQYNLDFSNGVLISKTAGAFDANELTAVNYKTITLLSDEPDAVTRQTIAAQNTRNGFFQGRLNRKIKSGVAANEYLYPLGFRLTGGTGVLANYFYTPSLLKSNSITNNQYLVGTYLHDQSNPTADGVGIGFTGHGCLNAFEIDDIGGPTASTCNNKEIDILSTFYWDFQENTGPAANGNPLTSAGALGAVDYDLETAGDVYTLQALDGLTGSQLRLLQRPSVAIPGNVGQGPLVTTEGAHNGTNISANTGIAQYSIVAASLKGARRDALTVFGGFASAGNGPSPLPVELLFFHAERSGEKNVLCTWETATEINNDHFELEAARERGGMLVFDKIGYIQGAGNSSQTRAYSFLDQNPQAGRNYYRLRQVDYDGTAGYSKMVVVQFNSGRKFDILATSPNPFIANPVMYLQSEIGGALVVQVENSIGQIVYRNELILSKGSSNLVLELPETLSSGLYFVRTIFDDEQLVGRLLKQ